MECVTVSSITEQQRKELFKGNNLYYYNGVSKVIQIDDNIIGFYTPHFLFDRLTIEFNLFEQYRHHGLGYTFVNMVTEMVGKEYPDYDSIFLFIRSDNFSSLTVALQNGYTQVYNEELQQMVEEEMSNYFIYYKKNEFYKNPVKSKQLLHKI